MVLFAIYRIAGNIDVFDAFQPDRQNLTHQNFKAIQRLVKDCDHPSKYFVKYLKSQCPSKFPPVKISRYTVSVPMWSIICQVYHIALNFHGQILRFL